MPAFTVYLYIRLRLSHNCYFGLEELLYTIFLTIKFEGRTFDDWIIKFNLKMSALKQFFIIQFKSLDSTKLLIFNVLKIDLTHMVHLNRKNTWSTFSHSKQFNVCISLLLHIMKISISAGFNIFAYSQTPKNNLKSLYQVHSILKNSVKTKYNFFVYVLVWCINWHPKQVMCATGPWKDLHLTVFSLQSIALKMDTNAGIRLHYSLKFYGCKIM